MLQLVESNTVAGTNSQQPFSHVKDRVRSANINVDKTRQAVQFSKRLHASLWEKVFHPLTERSQRLHFDKLFRKGFTFPIDKELISPATRVIFNDTNHLMQQICLK